MLHGLSQALVCPVEAPIHLGETLVHLFEALTHLIKALVHVIKATIDLLKASIDLRKALTKGIHLCTQQLETTRRLLVECPEL